MPYDYRKITDLINELHTLSLCPYEHPSAFGDSFEPILNRLAGRGLVECNDTPALHGSVPIWRCTSKGMEVLDGLMAKRISSPEDLVRKLYGRPKPRPKKSPQYFVSDKGSNWNPGTRTRPLATATEAMRRLTENGWTGQPSITVLPSTRKSHKRHLKLVK